MAAPAGLTSAMVWLSLWVSTPMTWSTLSASMGRCLLRGVAVSVPALARETAWQDCDGSRRTADRLLIRPTSRSARPAPAPRQTVQCQGSPSGRQLRWESCRGTSADPDSDPSRPLWQSHSCICCERAESRQTTAMRTRRPGPAPIPRSAFAGFSFPSDVIVLAVRRYLRFALSYRDVEELLAERGIEVDHVTIYRWVQRFTPLLAEAARPCRHAVGDRWFVDETTSSSPGSGATSTGRSTSSARSSTCLCRHAGTSRRPAGFFGQATKVTKVAPVEVTTDQAATYPIVLEDLLPAARHPTDQYANNRVECDHGRLKSWLRPMRGLNQDLCARIVIEPSHRSQPRL